MNAAHGTHSRTVKGRIRRSDCGRADDRLQRQAVVGLRPVWRDLGIERAEALRGGSRNEKMGAEVRAQSGICRTSCRRQFHASARRWALDAIGSGALTLGDIKNEFERTRTLLQASSDAVGVTG